MYRAPNLQKPSLERVGQISDQLGLDIDPKELGDYHEVVCGFLDKYAVLDKYPEPKLPVKYPRTPGYRPPPEENKYNAWYYKTDIPGASSGVLHGKTVVVKDSIPVAGVPMMMGSRVLEGYVPDYDPTAVTKLLDAGARITGKGVCPNFCLDAHSFTAATGTVLNPHDTTRVAGGSTSGCAALLAAGEADLALGGDQGGSIRIPASWCGVVGMKPTYGLIPCTGVHSLSYQHDHMGPLARNAWDCALMLEVLSGYDGGLDPRQLIGDFKVPKYTEYLTGDLSGVKVALLKEGFEGCEPDVDSIIRGIAQKLTTKGAIVEEVSIPMHKDAGAISIGGFLEGFYHTMINGSGHQVGPPGYYATSAIENLHAFHKARARDHQPMIKTVCIVGQHIMENYGLRFYAKSQNLSRMVRDVYDETFKDYDVMVMPTVKFKAMKLPPADISVKDSILRSLNNAGNTSPFNSTGHPCLTVNAGFSEGLPVGMQITGRNYEDATVLKVAHVCEQLRDDSK